MEFGRRVWCIRGFTRRIVLSADYAANLKRNTEWKRKQSLSTQSSRPRLVSRQNCQCRQLVEASRLAGKQARQLLLQKRERERERAHASRQHQLQSELWLLLLLLVLLLNFISVPRCFTYCCHLERRRTAFRTTGSRCLPRTIR